MDFRYYKGDQNLAWDAIPIDMALLGKIPQITFFLQDEKLGTADARIPHLSRFELTTDYCNKNTGAVWIHQDISLGPFYSLPFDSKIIKKLGFPLKHLDESYEKVIEKFGLGSLLESLGIRHRPGQLIRSITEGENYIGIVPTTDEQKSISSYMLADTELLNAYLFMFLAAYRGALKSVSCDKWTEVSNRARKFLDFIKSGFKEGSSVSDLQELIWKFGFVEFFRIDPPIITRASDIFCIKGDIPHETLLVLLQNPEVFSKSYNEALNEAHLPLKRLSFKNNSMELPYFIECEYDGQLVRWRMRATFSEKIILKLSFKNDNRTIELPKSPTIDDLAKGIEEQFGCHTIIGKAGPLLSELSRPPRTVALPEMGSKYAPMVGFLTKQLQNNGINFPNGHLVRVGINALDCFDAIGDEEIILPPFLANIWGPKKTGYWIAKNWSFCAENSSRIENLTFDCGQLLTLARYALAEFQSINLQDAKFKKLGNVEGFSKPMTDELASKIEHLLVARDEILKERRSLKSKFERIDDLKEIEKAIKLLMIGILKRHSQIASLFYLNRRPYSISFYLTFGSKIINAMTKSVRIREELC